ncbi:MAG: hypothetical protein C0404_03470 [Verrucomicrobia bacterium]|nr:hypothetical protein [Verrucomicrobiota bacterium]
MFRFIGYMICLIAAGWLVLEDLYFRKAIRDDLDVAQEVMFKFDPDSPGAHGKIMNGYYSDIYKHLPHMIIPALLVCAGASVLLLSGRKSKTEPSSGGDSSTRAARASEPSQT